MREGAGVGAELVEGLPERAGGGKGVENSWGHMLAWAQPLQPQMRAQIFLIHTLSSTEKGSFWLLPVLGGTEAPWSQALPNPLGPGQGVFFFFFFFY